MEAVAKLKNTRGSARKSRLLADLIRGKDVYDALNILKFNPKAASEKMEKLLLSAINNWEQANEGLRAEDSDLFLKQIFVDGGTVMKRWQPAPFGRAHRIRKRNCHITIIIDSRLDLDEKYELEEEPEVEMEDENIEE